MYSKTTYLVNTGPWWFRLFAEGTGFRMMKPRD